MNDTINLDGWNRFPDFHGGVKNISSRWAM